MKIVNQRVSKIQVKEYEVGKVYQTSDMACMVVETDGEYHFVNLEDGNTVSNMYGSLQELYAWCDHIDERLVNAELVIKDGANQ